MKKMLMENIKDAIYESHRHHVEAIKHRVVVRILRVYRLFTNCKGLYSIFSEENLRRPHSIKTPGPVAGKAAVIVASLL